MKTTTQKVAITTGDSDGIGTEITSKALYQLKKHKPSLIKNRQFFIWRSKACPLTEIKRIQQSVFSYKKVCSWQEAFKVPSQYHLVDIESDTPPPKWVEESALLAKSGKLDALVTAPLSKESLQNAGFLDKGHTDILKRTDGHTDIFMSFIGSQFAVVLLTDHIPVCQVSQKLSLKQISKGLIHAWSLQKIFFKKTKPIGLLGLNPHAGEKGLLGSEEQNLFLPAIKAIKKDVLVKGPLVPDVAFQSQQRKTCNVFVASYHDQGLIPFKSLHKSHTGVQITLGLNFVRTSVDHGTAKDIFGKNKANPQSMIKAIETALHLLKKQT